MELKKKNPLRRRIAGSFASSVVSISLMLLLVGAASALILNAKNVSDHFRRNVKVSVILKGGVPRSQAENLQRKLEVQPYTAKTHYVSVEEGTKELIDMLGEDFLRAFSTNPVPSSIDVTLNPEYVTSDSLKTVKGRIEDISAGIVDEISCQEALVGTLEKSIAKISGILAVLVALMLFISVVLIGNTVRLSLYAQRFTIRFMQLVGATRAYIAEPFMLRAAFQGLISAFVAITALIAGMFILKGSFPLLFEIFRFGLILEVVFVVIAFGVGVCTVSTYAVVGKITNMNNDELYG